MVEAILIIRKRFQSLWVKQERRIKRKRGVFAGSCGSGSHGVGLAKQLLWSALPPSVKVLIAWPQGQPLSKRLIST